MCLSCNGSLVRLFWASLFLFTEPNGSAFVLFSTSSLVMNHKHLVCKLVPFFRAIEKHGCTIAVEHAHFGVCIYTL